MTQAALCLTGGVIFDGETLHRDLCALFEGGVFSGICAAAAVPDDARRIALNGGILSPGYVDVQVNGGGGIMLNDDPSVTTLERMIAAHRKLGVAAIMPTLISDSADKTRAAIGAVEAAIKAGVPGIAGLHLEGPHLSVARNLTYGQRFAPPGSGPSLASVCDLLGLSALLDHAPAGLSGGEKQRPANRHPLFFAPRQAVGGSAAISF